MNSALNESEYYDSPYDFLDGFLQRQTKGNRFVKHQTKPSKSSSASDRSLDDREPLENSTENEPFSGKDFLDGFSQRQTNSVGFVQHQTKSPKYYSAASGCSHDERDCLDNSAENKLFSEKNFLGGFLQRSKSETDPYGASKFNSYESLDNSIDRKHSPRAHLTKKRAIASTKTKSDEFVQHTESANSFAASERKLDERGRLNHSTGWNPSTRHTSKPPFVSTQTPSPYTQYISTRTTSSESNAASQHDLEEKEWSKTSTEKYRSLQYTKKPSIASIQTPSPSTQYLSTTTTSSRSSSYFCQKISEAEWKELEKKSQLEQKEFLDTFLKDGKFEHEKVDSHTKNVKRGDHILCQGAFGKLYTHHLLCKEVDGDDIHVIEYTGQSLGFSGASGSVATSNPLAFAAIKKGTLTYKELEKKKVSIKCCLLLNA